MKVCIEKNDRKDMLNNVKEKFSSEVEKHVVLVNESNDLDLEDDEYDDKIDEDEDEGVDGIVLKDGFTLIEEFVDFDSIDSFLN